MANAAIKFLPLPSERGRRSNRKGRRAYIFTGLAIILIVVVAAAGWARLASYSAGQDLLSNTANFSTDHPNFAFLFGGAISPVYVIPISGDKQGVCAPIKDGSRVDIYLLGRGNGGAFVLLFQQNGEESNGRVAFLPSADYGLVSASPLSSGSFGGCHARGVYNDPGFP
jgi:hypothetical protein